MSFEKYITKNGKKFRLGYTTGTTTAGAAKAAAKILLKEKAVAKVVIDTPAGIAVEMEVEDCYYSSDLARAAVVKDAGDDPDQTDGIKIIAELKRIKQDRSIAESQVFIKGAEGIGRVRKPGLQLEIGEAAINPVPREMIREAIREVFPENNIFEVEISAPAGVEIARKTFNPKLGIEGGISILGTSGIVEPMSETAYKESLAVELKQAVALGHKKLALVFGNHGKKRAAALGFEEETIIRMSNFVGFMLEEAKELELEEIIIIGHIGKIVKVAGGIFNTHSKIADARREIIAAYTALKGVEKEIIEEIFNLNTAEETADYLINQQLISVLTDLAEAVVEKVETKVENKIKCRAIIFTLNRGIVAYSQGLEEEFNLE